MPASLARRRVPARKRDPVKCSVCRARKIRCNPQPRDWDVSHQRCEYCDSRDLPCGPNLKYDEDPAVLPAPENSQETTHSPAIEASLGSSARIVSVSAQHQSAENIETEVGCLTHSGQARKRRRHSDASSQDEAVSKMNDFYALVTILAWRSLIPPTLSQDPYPSQPYYISSIEEKLQTLFIKLNQLGNEAYLSAQYDRTRWIICQLIVIMDKHPKLYDGRKHETLLKMANTLRSLGHTWCYEHVLWRISNIQDVPLPQGMHKKVCQLLCESLIKTSGIIRDFLTKMWTKTETKDLPSNLDIPPLHRAAQNPNPDVVLELLSHLHGKTSLPAIVHEHGLPAAADAFDCKSSLELNQMRAITDLRDFCGRTPLFSAAADGCEECCGVLLLANADPDSRDLELHTVLEAAIRGGHNNVVQQLLTAGSEINPDMAGSASSPLQAAIESDTPDLELIHHLLEKGADVDVRRFDNMNAIDLAEKRKLSRLVDLMRNEHSNPTPGPFSFT